MHLNKRAELSGSSANAEPIATLAKRALRLVLRLLLLCTWIGAGSCAAPGKLSDDPDRRELLALSDLNNAPFAWVDADGVPRGRDVEMMQAIAANLGRELTWQRMPFEELLPHVMAHKPGVICATIGITAERAEHLDFTRPYFLTELRVVVRTGPGEPAQLAELSRRAVAAGTGTTSQSAVERSLPNATHCFENKSGNTSLQRLIEAEVDAVVMDGPAAQALVQASGGRLRLLEESLGGERYALAIALDQAELLNELNRALAQLEESGWLSELNRKFGLTSAIEIR